MHRRRAAGAQYVYPEEESDQRGDPDFNPKLRAQRSRGRGTSSLAHDHCRADSDCRQAKGGNETEREAYIAKIHRAVSPRPNEYCRSDDEANCINKTRLFVSLKSYHPPRYCRGLSLRCGSGVAVLRRTAATRGGVLPRQQSCSPVLCYLRQSTRAAELSDSLAHLLPQDDRTVWSR